MFHIELNGVWTVCVLGCYTNNTRMSKSNEELISELETWQSKYAALESKNAEDMIVCKKKEEELSLQLTFFEGIANSTVDGFLVVDTHGQKVLQTQRTIDLWKIPQEVVDDLSGVKQVEHIMHMTVDPQKFIAEIQYQMVHVTEKRHDEVELIDGTVMERYSQPVFGVDGTHYGRIYTFHDITEQKKIERQLIQLNSDKDRFISILSHDLRSPFNGLLGVTELLLERFNEMSDEEKKEMLTAIYKTLEKTHALLEDTLMWASVQSDKVAFSPCQTEVTAYLDEIVDILKPVAGMKNITFVNNTKEPVNGFLDVYMFKAIVRNLASNAIKFTPNGGMVVLSATHKEGCLLISVKDNGVGMTQEAIDKLFNISSTISTMGTANEMGTGLGFMLCKNFIDMHGGKIWVESEINKGTTVYFSLPMPD